MSVSDGCIPVLHWRLFVKRSRSRIPLSVFGFGVMVFGFQKIGGSRWSLNLYLRSGCQHAPDGAGMYWPVTGSVVLFIGMPTGCGRTATSAAGWSWFLARSGTVLAVVSVRSAL